MIRIYSQSLQGQSWLQRYQGKRPLFACVLGFTATGLIPGISAAGATPHDRQFTAIADAEFLCNGPQPNPRYALPPLQGGVSPVIITRAVLESLHIPFQIFDAGLPHTPAIPTISLQGTPACCLSTGQALPLKTVEGLFQQGLDWGEKLAEQALGSYCILAECVAGGTTTALAVLTGLGLAADGLVNSSHPICNHEQKRLLVRQGLQQAGLIDTELVEPLRLIAAVGDPMQIVVAAMALSASQTCGVLLAGGTQMLAVYALCCAIAATYSIDWQPQQVVVGTTRWVAEDATGNTVGLANLIGHHDGLNLMPCLLATQLSFTQSRYRQLQLYEQGYVKEGVGAGGAAISAYLYQQWEQPQLLQAIESQVARLAVVQNSIKSGYFCNNS